MPYFDSSKRILGILVTHPSQVHEVAWFANGFAPPVDVRLSELPAYLQSNNGRMLPIIDLAVHLFDRTTGVLVYDYGMALEHLLQTVEKNHNGRVLFWWNEILWQIRIACLSGKQAAINEVLSDYANVQHQALLIGQEIRRRIPGSGILHIEASAELVQQMNTVGGVIMFEDCEYLAFDCYGPVANCGGRPQNDYLIWLWNFREMLEQERPINRKLFLIPGAFQDSFAFPEEPMCISQLKTYCSIFDAWPDGIGGMGVFTWGTVVEAHNTIVGAKYLRDVSPAVVWALYDRRG